MDLGLDGTLFRLLIAFGIISLVFSSVQSGGLDFLWVVFIMLSLVCLLLRAIK